MLCMRPPTSVRPHRPRRQRRHGHGTPRSPGTRTRPQENRASHADLVGDLDARWRLPFRQEDAHQGRRGGAPSSAVPTGRRPLDSPGGVDRRRFDSPGGVDRRTTTRCLAERRTRRPRSQ